MHRRAVAASQRVLRAGTAPCRAEAAHLLARFKRWPMDEAGFPFLVVAPPIYPDNSRDDTRQEWTYAVYKDPAVVPEEIYSGPGRVKPKYPRGGW
jgi:hypothetical protein